MKDMSKMKPQDVPDSWLRDKMNEEIKKMRSFEDAKIWESHGFKCIAKINRTPGGSFTFPVGYVGVPREHPDFAKFYDDVDVDAPGGLTYSDPWPELNDELWYFGFDCGHGWDYYEDGDTMLSSATKDLDDLLSGKMVRHVSNKSLEYAIEETNKLAKQLAERWENKDGET